MRLRLTPLGGDFLQVHWRIGGNNHYFRASGVIGGQFSAFLSAVYGLYEEADNSHYRCDKYNRDCTHHISRGEHSFTSQVTWDGEGPSHTISFARHSGIEGVALQGQPDPVDIDISGTRTWGKHTVDGRDLCYAVARGCTEALKKYGFKGYTLSTSGYDPGDSFDLVKLLFIKAYALGVPEWCTAKRLWEQPRGWAHAEATDFEKEMQLLLFDM